MHDMVVSEDRAVLAGWFYVPLRVIGTQAKLRELTERLTYMPKFAEDGEQPIKLFDAIGMPGYLGVPRAFGLHRYAHLPVEDRTSLGVPMVGVNQYVRPDPNHPSVRDPQAQAAFMVNLRQAAQTWGSFIAVAPTGSGKTVSGLNMALDLGRKTIIFVHLDRLKDQWIEKALMGILKVPERRIGVVQGPICEWQDRDFVVAMLPTMNLYEYDPAFYSAFGTCLFDEVHRIGSRFFTPTVPMFNARVKCGLSATPTRKDGGDRVFVWHLGPIRVRSEAEAMPCEVIVLRHRNPEHEPPAKFQYGQRPTILAKALASDPLRNMTIVRMIKRFHEADRQALIVGHSVRHLQDLMLMCERQGIPRAAMGQFTSEIHIRVKENGRLRWKKRKQKKEVLDLIQKNSQLLFATYGMFSEGVDEPRLDAGMDVTPASTATQLIGRIRRPLPGKKKPKWVTILDEDCGMAVKNYQSRKKDYIASGAEVIGDGQT